MHKIHPHLMVLILQISAVQLGHAEIPASSFGHIPQVENAVISPDGNYVAAVLNSNDGPEVAVGRFGSTEMGSVLALKNTDDRIEWIRWANNDRLLVSASYSARSGVDRVRVNRMYSVDKSGGEALPLVSNIGITKNAPKSRRPLMQGDRVLSLLPEEPSKILVELFNYDFREWTVYELDIYTNEFEKQLIKQFGNSRLFVDTNGRVAMMVEWESSDESLRYWSRELGQTEWQLIRKENVRDEESFVPVVVQDGGLLVISNHDVGRDVLWQVDTASGSFEKILFAATDYDVAHVLLGPDMTRVIGVVHYDDRRRETYFDAPDISAQQTAAESLPGFDMSIVSQSLDRTRLLILISRDDFPPKYVWLDTANKRGGAWLSQYPELEAVELAKTSRIDFKAGDGLPISGYLTMPVNSTRDLPSLVVYPHDGPIGRSAIGFDPYVQFFASRGFAVLQINHRGSAGFNFDFVKGGYREWGGKMQQDVYDGIAWLHAQNLVNTDKACFVGHGYGGFVALTAAHEKSEQFNCFVSIGGISNIVDHVQTAQKYSVVREQLEVRVGDIFDREQKKKLQDSSPIEHAAEITGPVLLIHGVNDATVQYQQTQQLFQRIRYNNRNNRFLSLEDGTHALDDNANRRKTFQALDEFLNRHLN